MPILARPVSFVGVVDVMRTWTPRHWTTAVVGAVVATLVIGLPTDVIPNPVFGRPVPVTWWSPLILAVTAVLSGLLLATYVRPEGVHGDGPVADELDRPARAGGLGGLLSFFAVGCPVCNKLVVVALGTVGARRWFEPVQPYLAAVSIVLLVMAVRTRLRYAAACPVRT